MRISYRIELNDESFLRQKISLFFFIIMLVFCCFSVCCFCYWLCVFFEIYTKKILWLGMTCPTRQQPGIGLNVHVRTFKYCRQVGHVQVCPCAERTRKARNHLQPECFGCIRTHTYTNPYTHRYNFVIVAVAIQQAYRVHRLSFVLCADCHLTLVCLRSCSFMFLLLCCCCS